MSATPTFPSDPSSDSLESLILRYPSDPTISRQIPYASHPWLGDNCDDMKYFINIPSNFPYLIEASALLETLLLKVHQPKEGLSRQEAAEEYLQWQTYFPAKVLFELQLPLAQIAHKLLLLSDNVLLKDFTCKRSKIHKLICLDDDEKALIGFKAWETLRRVGAFWSLLNRGVRAVHHSRAQWENVGTRLGLVVKDPRKKFGQRMSASSSSLAFITGQDQFYLQLMVAWEKKMDAEMEREKEKEKEDQKEKERIMKQNLSQPKSVHLGRVFSWAQSYGFWLTISQQVTNIVKYDIGIQKTGGPEGTVYDEIPDSNSSSVESSTVQQVTKRRAFQQPPGGPGPQLFERDQLNLAYGPDVELVL